MAVKPIPDGYHTVTPYLTVDDPGAVIDFLKKAFDAQETYAMRDSEGKVRHAEVKVGNSMLMLGGARGESMARPGNFYLYVEDVSPEELERRAQAQQHTQAAAETKK